MHNQHLPHGGYSNVATKDDLETQGLLADSARRQIIAVFGLLAAQTALIMSVVK